MISHLIYVPEECLERATDDELIITDMHRKIKQHTQFGVLLQSFDELVLL